MMSNLDYFGRYEQPELILCNPDDTEIGIIVGVEQFESNMCFGGISDISYQIYQSEINNDIYEKHVERRQVKVSGIGFFIITNSSEHKDEKGLYKSIQAKSCEYELNGISMPYISGTYQLYKAENFEADNNEEIANRDDETYLNDNCILYEIMSVIPSWELDGHLEFLENSKYEELAEEFRTFEDKDTSVYSFLINDLQDSYGCYVSFDIEKRKIRILHHDDVFSELPMIISRANILGSCEITTTIDNYVNSMFVEGTDGVNISAFNPMGTSLIYDFNHDINIGLIDGVLKEALQYWESNIKLSETYMGEYYCDVPSIQKWINASKKLSAYKKSILEAIGTGEEYIVAELLNSTDFLTDIGLEESSDREVYIDAIEDSIWVDTNGEPIFLPNINKIDNIFLELSFNKSAILSTDFFYYKNDEMRISDLSKLLYCAQELKAQIETEVKSLESYLKGYNSQRKALVSTVVEGTYSNELRNEIAKVDFYISLVFDALFIYGGSSEVVNSTPDSGALPKIISIINSISNLLSDTYSYNSFEGSFARFLLAHPEYDITPGRLYSDLTRYIKQQTYTDDTIVITEAMGLEEKFKQEEELYNSSVQLLSKTSVPAYEIKIGVEAFMFSEKYAHIVEELNMHSAIYVELPSGDSPLFHLLKISINYDENTCEITFGNRLRLSDPASVFSDLQHTVTSAASIVSSERVVWGAQKEKINQLMLSKNAAIDSTFRSMSNSFNKTVFGDDGFRCYAVDDNGDKTYGIWCANGTMMFTDGETPKMAIGRIIKSDGSTEYGFYGKSIIANTVTTDKLVAGALSKGTNLIRNGSFEASSDYWDIGDSGVSIGGEYNSPIGYRYMLINSGYNISQDIAEHSVSITPGTYILSFYYRPDAESDNMNIMSGLRASITDNNVQIGNCIYSDNQTVIPIYRSSEGSNEPVLWARCYHSLEVTTTLSNPIISIINESPFSACVDGVMLEKSVDLNDYTPHISEVYSRYTSINDNGISVHGGKIKIYDSYDRLSFFADDEGNLSLVGSINASSGSIGGWLISSDKMYKGGTGMSSTGNYAFFAGAENENGVNSGFSVTHEGELYSSSGKIGGWNISENSLYKGYVGLSPSGTNVFYAGDTNDYNFRVSQSGILFARNAEIDNNLKVTMGPYTMEIDGYSILMKYNNSDTFSSAISFATTTDNSIFSGTSTNNANLAIAGSDKILFGTRPGGNWKPLCEISHTLSGSILNSFRFQPSNNLGSLSYLGSPDRRWDDLFLDGIVSLSGATTGSVKKCINDCNSRINLLLGLSVIKNALGL